MTKKEEALPDTLAYGGFKKSAVENEQKKRKKKKFGAITCEVLPEESHVEKKVESSEETFTEQTKVLSKSDLKHADTEELVVSDAKTGNHEQICCKRWMVTRGSRKRHAPMCQLYVMPERLKQSLDGWNKAIEEQASFKKR